MTIFGWDASDYDWGRGPMDLVSAKAAGVDFFTYKATEGTSTKHAHYGEALARARDAGVEFLGAYIVPRTPGPSVQSQVDYFLSYVTAQTPWWPSWPAWFWQVDTEKWGYDNVSSSVGEQVADVLRQRTGRWVVHYAPQWAYGDSIPQPTPLWASNYGNNPAVPLKQGYPGDGSSRWQAYSGRVPVFLQYGSQLIIGRQPTCDGNAYRGTTADLRAMIIGNSQQEEDMPYLVRVADSKPTNGAIHLVTGTVAASGRLAAYRLTPEAFEAHKVLGMTQVDIKHAADVADVYDFDPQPFPSGGGGGNAVNLVVELSGTAKPETP